MDSENTSVENQKYVDYMEVGQESVLTDDAVDTDLKSQPSIRRFRWVNPRGMGLVGAGSHLWMTSRIKGYPKDIFKSHEPEIMELNKSFTRIKRLKVRIPFELAIWNHLKQFPKMAKPLSDACDLSRQEFQESELSLEIFYDPESNDQYPTLYVREEFYQDDILDRIEKISENFDRFFERNVGWFLITTDFKSKD